MKSFKEIAEARYVSSTDFKLSPSGRKVHKMKKIADDETDEKEKDDKDDVKEATLNEYEAKDGVYRHQARPGRYGGSEKESDYVAGPSKKELDKIEAEKKKKKVKESVELEESAEHKAAAEVHHQLLHGVMKHGTSAMTHNIKAIMKDHGATDYNKVKDIVRKKGYAGKFDESVEQIDELQKSTLANYAKKSTAELPKHQMNATYKATGPIANAHAGKHPKTGESPIEWDNRKVKNRGTGITRAIDKLAKESVELEETVTVKKHDYSWGKMVTVHHGADTSYPLHPEHQAAIKKLKHGEKTSFKDETGAHVTAHREDDKVHLSSKGSNRKTTVAHSHFNESVELDEATDKQEQRILMLARLGLVDKTDVSKLRVALEQLKADKQLTVQQRTLLLGVMSDLISLVTGDDTVFNRVKMDVQKEDYEILEEEDVVLESNDKDKDDTPPFDPDPKKPASAKAGKYGSGYSTARHLARLALQKQQQKKQK